MTACKFAGHAEPRILPGRHEAPQAAVIAAVGDCAGQVAPGTSHDVSSAQIGAQRFEETR